MKNIRMELKPILVKNPRPVKHNFRRVCVWFQDANIDGSLVGFGLVVCLNNYSNVFLTFSEN